MKKNHFFMAYYGNKRTECEKLYDEVKDKLDNIEYIVEPFCGTSAFSYYLSLKHPHKFKYILNDNNKYLIDMYNIITDEEELNKLIIVLNDFSKDLTRDKYNEIVKKDELSNWLYKNIVYSIRPGLFPQDRPYKKDFEYLKSCPIVNFLKTEDIIFFNVNGIDVLNKYKDNNKALIFLDPPYLMACNDFYSDSKVNIYEYLYFNKITDMNALLLICLENVWIIKLLFQNNIKNEYAKKYQTTKKNTSHLIISNF
jgi:site-specific DNA-adenine methylase